MTHGPAKRISLRRDILTRLGQLVLSTSLLVGVVFALFGLRPLSTHIAESQFNAAAARVEAGLNATFAPATRLLAISRDWIAGEAPDLDNPEAFNRLFRPVLKNLPQVTSVVAGTVTGQGWLLLKQADGRWRNRMTDIPRWGDRHLIVDHLPDGRVAREWQTLGYDARERPWFKLAQSGDARSDAHWTSHYSFYTTGDPGITASTRMRLKDGRDFIIGFDVMLRDISQTTMHAQVGQHGMVLVVTDDRRVLALPAPPNSVDQAGWLGKILKPARELGLAPLNDALDKWREHGRATGEVWSFLSENVPWLATVRPYPLGEQMFWVVTLAPAADFSPAWGPVAAGLIGALGLALLVAMLMTRAQARHIAGPLETLAETSKRIGQLDFTDTPAVSSRIAEINQLACAQASMRAMLQHHQETLATQARELRESEAYNKVLFADSRIPLVVLDPASGRFVDCNQAAADIYRLGRREAVLGLTPLDVSAPLQDDGSTSAEAATRHIELALRKGSDVFEWRHRLPDGEEWDAEVHLMSFHHQERTLLQFSLQDVTERKRAEDKLEQLAFFDTLTGLPNRALLLDRLQQILATAQRHERGVTLLYLDLDRFKEINDTQGHTVGDIVLKEIASRFEAVLRADESIARMGGDEFVVIVAGASQVATALVAERLTGALAAPVEVNGLPFSLGMSIGIVQYPADGTTPELLLRHADVAMYRAKSSGGGYRFYRPEMSEGLAEHMALAHDLRAALQGQHGELALHYQPQVDLRNGALIGAEALIRWHHPDQGMISPAAFIPIAEERGMMGELGAWVLREACRQLNTWQAEGLALPGRLAVNIATQQIESADFPDQAVAIVRNAGLSPEQFELELTESGLMRNVELAINIAGRLKVAGFALAIDDFGTGYSSLAYLKRLPANKIKIDMSFVRDMLEDRNDKAIVTTIIAMGRTLELQTIAEGVETVNQAESLLELGCGEAQGYHFGRPEPAASFAERWLGG